VQEEVRPGFPVPFGAHKIEQTIVLLSILFKVEAEVVERFGQYPSMMQEKCNQQHSNSAVAVKKGVNSLELNVRKCGFDQRRVR